VVSGTPICGGTSIRTPCVIVLDRVIVILWCLCERTLFCRDTGRHASSAERPGVINRPHYGDHSQATIPNGGSGRLMKTAEIAEGRLVFRSTLEIVVEAGRPTGSNYGIARGVGAHFGYMHLVGGKGKLSDCCAIKFTPISKRDLGVLHRSCFVG
jgi:hypothetical protein